MHYVYPYPHVDEVLPLMAEGLVLPYLDVPFQHAHPEVLKRMKRPASGERNLERIQGWRKVVPELTVRSTFIAGFPGETEAQFDELLAFLKEAELDRVGCFAYSPVEGAAANALDARCRTRSARIGGKRFMQVQQRISRRRLKRKVGTVQRVLVDAAGPEGAIARSMADAPEIDGVVHVAPHPSLKVGTFVEVAVDGSDAHDLSGTVVAGGDEPAAARAVRACAAREREAGGARAAAPAARPARAARSRGDGRCWALVRGRAGLRGRPMRAVAQAASPAAAGPTPP